MKLLQIICGLFGHKWASYTKGQMCKRCGKKKNMDKWYYEIKEDNKQNELTMLVNKENQDVFLVVPNVVEGERYFIIKKCDFPSEYHIGDVYLSKEKWLKKCINKMKED